MATAQADRYIYPPRPDAAIPRENTAFLENSTWTAQLKFNDSRCLIKFLPNGKIELWNRHGEQFRDYHPTEDLIKQLHQTKAILGLPEGQYHLLDGGLLDKKHRAIKDTIVIWDILVQSGQWLVGTTYDTRYDQLFHESTHNAKLWNFSHKDYPKPFTFGYALTNNILFPHNHESTHWAGLWDDIETINKPWFDQGCGPLIEGLVFKDTIGILKRAFREKNNAHWIMRSRVKTGRHAF